MRNGDINGRVEVEWTERPAGSVVEDIEHINTLALTLESGRSDGLSISLHLNESALLIGGIDNLIKESGQITNSSKITVTYAGYEATEPGVEGDLNRHARDD